MKILFISLGSIGLRHLSNIKKLAPKSEIKILRLKNKSKKKQYNNQITEKEVYLFNPDLIIINSPSNKHFEYFKKFHNKKNHFFIEKPIDSSIKNINKKTLLDFKNFSMVGYVLRFNHILLKLKKIILEKKFGNINLVDIKVGKYLPDWRTNNKYYRTVSAQKKLGGGVLLELSHEIDYATWLFGYPDKVFCVAKKISNFKTDVEDIASIIFEYPKKIIQISLDMIQRVPKREIKIVCTKATIYVDLINYNLNFFNKKNPKGKKIKLSNPKNNNEIYLKQMDFLLFKVFKKYKPKYKQSKLFKDYSTLRSGYKTLRIIEKIKSSNQLKKKLNFK
jgi:predicted dehydrogenase